MELFTTSISEEAKQRVMSVLASEHLSEGEVVAQLEKELENIFGYSFGVAVNSGTSALHLALVLAGVKQGDEVILPAQTFVATGLAVLYCRAKCVFADVHMDGNISVDSVSKLITKKTKAVIAVSWGGNPCDLYALSELCGRYRIKLIQDNAQALGATYFSFPVSFYGDYSCFSFQAIKQLTTGDGGLLVCQHYEDYKRAKKLRWFGIDREHDLPDQTGERRYNLREVGYKYHLNDFSAALGLGNLDGVLERQEYRKALAEQYDRNIPESFRIERKRGSSNWIYTVLVDRRNDLVDRLKSSGVPSSVVHVGIDRNQVFGSYTDLPNQRFWDGHHLCLPCNETVSFSDVEKIGEIFHAGW